MKATCLANKKGNFVLEKYLKNSVDSVHDMKNNCFVALSHTKVSWRQMVYDCGPTGILY